MPVILRAALYDAWLDPAQTEEETAAMLRPFDGELKIA
jgi:putative SOS response-associated peptidase YedK